MDLTNKRILVVGAGLSGQAVCRFLVAKQARVTLTDTRSREQIGQAAKELSELGVTLILQEYPPVARNQYDLVVMSPGVPLTVPPVVQAKEADIEVIGELELAYAFAKAPIVAITGTNGKTTTTSLIGQLFREAGFKTLVAGNIGLPMISEIENFTAEDRVVAEVSSFQLETTKQFAPRVAVILNITPDHLDRHGSMEEYIKAKARVFKQQGAVDYVVLNYDDPILRELAKDCPSQVIFFSRRHILEKGSFIQNGQIVVARDQGAEIITEVTSLRIPGAHNLENALAAAAAASALGVSATNIANTLRNFGGVAHRLEYVTTIDGVKYVNDSKGTNPDAAIKALEAYEAPIILIAGGKNKGVSFMDFAKKIKEKVRVLITLGVHGYQIEEAARAQGFHEIYAVENYAQAVELAGKQAKPGEIVLLSPACTSWDMFRNFEERGNLFKELVLGMQEKE
ncbi:UDP-N-acetylmuramoyl-L-alanine--D-glutamate ligase [Desulfotomaculum sp. 1211_IL3151]|uniref:UDP-N-acetylmuramoyl-L-alanine--D-glutamate ligase n=1 Tax=Desulfotomaculum sp. 1211_IL3151 TaxID=3084055 RepID=UPI002FDA3EDC